ncbi:helix-turn-helix domain-containing protein [Lacibacter sp. H375]|uniref:helix-turn-helix domain-containing protein n=1 Tax=Lacibacter sp. H375 TaxID=3133424 RepID=UPI0030BE89A3
MKYWYQKPNQLLSDYVRTVLILEGFSQAEKEQLPLVTNGIPAFLCRTEKTKADNEHISQLSLFGKSSTEDSWTINNTTTIIAYFFKPFALSTVFNVPAKTIMDAALDLSIWSPHKTNALKTQLAYASSTEKKTEVLDHLLIEQLQQNKKECEIIKYATDEIMCNPDTEILSAILTKLNINERTFQRTFKKYVGVTANQYRRICQFQVSFDQLRGKEFTKLTDIAYDNGFADQSHFIRSFKEFTQTTPNDYLKSGLKEKEQ